AADGSPKRGGTLRIGTAGASTTQSLDPVTWDDAFPYVLSHQIFNCLVEIDADSRPQPELAESWEGSDGASVWRFRLRRGVTFHDGRTMTAADVVWSLDYHRGPDSKSPARSLLAPVVEMRAEDDHTIVIRLRDGNADFPHLLSDDHLAVFPADTSDWSRVPGTGGYVLQSYEPGVRALATRNPNYWKSGRAHFDAIETVGINDVVARTTALQTGEVDVINRCELRTVDRLAGTPGIDIVEVTGTRHNTAPMRCDTAPFDSLDVRLALKYGLDRQRILDTVLRGHGVLGNDHPIAPGQRYHAADLPQRGYDPDRARFHLKQAGMDRLKLPLSTSDAAFAGAVDAAVLYQEFAAKAGIDIELVREPSDGYWSNVWLKRPWCMAYWSGRPTADWMFTQAYAADAKWNDSHWSHARFNELLVAARTETEDSRRGAMYAEMQSLVRDDGGVVVMAFANDVHAATTKLAYGALAANREFDGARIAERWWFA
ncbi:MAG: ABC transporter substrate-binding protein, partial [Planctomycetes bacterium]|nr:ABC transporter substrate-binding protein [Planctomycetota bacterium]